MSATKEGKKKNPHIDGGSPLDVDGEYATCRNERPHRTIIPACKRDKSISAKKKGRRKSEIEGESVHGRTTWNQDGEPSLFSHRTDQKCKCQPVRDTDTCTYTDRDTDKDTDTDTDMDNMD